MRSPHLRKALSRIRPLPFAGFLAALLAPSDAACQLHGIDSLRDALEARPTEDSITAETLYQLSRSYWIRDLDSAQAVAERLLRLAQRIAFTKGIGDAWNSLGVVHWYRGEYPTAMEAHQRALEVRMSLGRSDLIAASHHNIGLLHDDQGNYPEAIAHYLKALQRYESIGDLDGAAQEHNAIATVHSYQGELSAALAEHHKALTIRRRTDDLWGLSETYSNLGVIHTDMGRLDSAEHWYDLALELRMRIDDQQGLAISFNNLGDLFLLQGRHHEALENLQQALAINTRLGYRKSMGSVHLNLGRLFDATGDRGRAVSHMRMALELAGEVGALDMAHRALQLLSETSARMGRYAEAYAYRLRFEDLSDSLYNAERTRSLVRQQMEYTFAKKQLADSLAAAETLDRSRMDHALQLAAERNRRILITLGALLGLVVAVALWSRLRYMRRARDTILRTQERLVVSEKEREAEQVRTRIARDIHDEIGGELTRISMFGQEARHLMAHDEDAAGAMLDRMARSAREANGALRDIVWATDPARDTMQGLVEHLREIAHRQLDLGGMQANIRVHHAGNDRSVDPAWRTQVIRIVKEALNNAVKYAGARNITLLFTSDEDGFQLRITDDGQGFDPGTVARGNGLPNMRARAEAIGAAFSITSTPGKGCEVKVEGPLPTTQRSMP